MKRSIIALAVLLLPLLSLSSCPYSSSVHVQIENSCENFTENPKSNKDSVSIDVGDEVTVKL